MHTKPIGHQNEKERRQAFRRAARIYSRLHENPCDPIAAGAANLNTPIIKSEALEEAHQLSLVKALPGASLALVVFWAFLSGWFLL